MTSDPNKRTVSTVSFDDGQMAARMVRQFYHLVDCGDVHGLAVLFAPDAEYRRPGYDPMVGREKILHFYLETRIVRAGKHLLTTLLTDGYTVGAFGDFHGVLYDGNSVDLRFADRFTVRPDGLFSSRDTYFFSPFI